MRHLMLLSVLWFVLAAGGCALPRMALEHAELTHALPLPPCAKMREVHLGGLAHVDGGTATCVIELDGPRQESIDHFADSLKTSGWEVRTVGSNGSAQTIEASRKRWWAGEETLRMHVWSVKLPDGTLTKISVELSGNFLFCRESKAFLDASIEAMMGGGVVVGTLLWIPNAVLVAIL